MQDKRVEQLLEMTLVQAENHGEEAAAQQFMQSVVFDAAVRDIDLVIWGIVSVISSHRPKAERLGRILKRGLVWVGHKGVANRDEFERFQRLAKFIGGPDDVAMMYGRLADNNPELARECIETVLACLDRLPNLPALCRIVDLRQLYFERFSNYLARSANGGVDQVIVEGTLRQCSAIIVGLYDCGRSREAAEVLADCTAKMPEGAFLLPLEFLLKKSSIAGSITAEEFIDELRKELP